MADIGGKQRTDIEQQEYERVRENFLLDLRLLEEHKTSPEWIATKYLYELLIPHPDQGLRMIPLDPDSKMYWVRVIK